MARPDRSKRFDQSQMAVDAARPKIWVDGQQRPRFDLRAYAAVSLGMAKRALAPEMQEAEGRLRAFGWQMSLGKLRPDLAWAGRWQRLVPSHHRVGAWVLFLARLFAEASTRLNLPLVAPSDLSHPDVFRGSDKVTPIRPPPAAAVPAPKPAEEPMLQAIRSAINRTPRDSGHVRLFSGADLPFAELAPPEPAAPAESRLATRLRQMAWGAASWTWLAVLIAFALPAGAIRALMFHLDGGDLADWS